MRNIESDHYPLTIEQDPSVVEQITVDRLDQCVGLLDLASWDRNALIRSFWNHYDHVEAAFLPEIWARACGDEFADLFYHRKEHALYQATYDSIEIVERVVTSRPTLLTQEGIVAAILGGIYHDIGYVDTEEVPSSYAARTPIHVEEGIKSMEAALRVIKLPSFLNRNKVGMLAKLAIHSTKFPYIEDYEKEAQGWIEQLDPETQEEAKVIRRIAKLADLGGQVARVDYFPRLVLDLRKELESATPGLGYMAIGTDDELGEKAVAFIEKFVFPSVGAIAKELLGENNSFQRSWDQHALKAHLYTQQRRLALAS